MVLRGLKTIKYWSSLSGVPGCLTDVMNSLFNGRVNFFGPTCCKAITLVNDHCLPKLFPFNPAFHSTLKNVCLTGSGVEGPTPSPLGADQITISRLYLPGKLTFPRTIRRELGKGRCKMLVITFKH